MNNAWKEQIKQARGGDGAAARRIAERYETGEGVRRNVRKAIRYYAMAIKAGDGEAALGVGKLYHKLWKNGGAYCGAAKYMLGEAAEKGYAEAQYLLARYYTLDCEEKAALLERAAAQGLEDAAYEYARLALRKGGGSLGAVIPLIARHAQLGKGRFAFLMGYCAEFGYGVEASDEEAVYWYRRSAESGDKSALFALGRMYREGRGVRRDLSRARDYISRAAYLGHAEAQYAYALQLKKQEHYKEARAYFLLAYGQGVHCAALELGLLAERGLPKKKSAKEAIFYYAKVKEELPEAAYRYARLTGDEASMRFAVENNYPEALLEAGLRERDERKLSLALDKGLLSARLPLALLCYEKKDYDRARKLLVEDESGEAFCCLGRMYLRGEGVLQSYRKAALAFAESAEQMDANGLCEYGKLLESGFGVRRDAGAALSAYEESARRGNAEAIFRTGVFYAEGVVEKNEALAAKRFALAADLGHGEAAYRYAGCLSKGYGCKKNVRAALKYLHLAAERGVAEAQCDLAAKVAKGKRFSLAADLYERALGNGCERAALPLAECYRYGRGRGADPDKAIALYERAAKLAGAELWLRMASWAETGAVGLCKDEKRAERYCHTAAQLGNPVAQYRVAQAFFEEGCEGDAVFWLTKSAENGYAKAKTALAGRYERGDGVREDVVRAAELYEQAKWQEAEAAFSLGECYRLGRGKPRDASLAFENYLRAAHMGHAGGQYRTAFCYETGEGTECNETEAWAWYRLAAAGGDAHAAFRAFCLKPSASEGLLAQAVRGEDGEALCLYGKSVLREKPAEGCLSLRKSAESGFAQGMYEYARCLLTGEGTQKDEKTAVAWLKKALERGVSEAERLYADCLSSGTGTDRNAKLAAYHYEMLAENGDVSAQLTTGDNYRYGRGVNVNYRRAYSWYLSSAQSGNGEAMYKLAVCLFDGIGVEKDTESAFSWMKKAFSAIYRTPLLSDSLREGMTEKNGEACCRIGDCFSNGLWVERSEEKAAYWYQKSADADCGEGWYRLGLAYLNGRGVSADAEESYRCFLKGASCGDSDAAYEAAVSLLDGRGTEANLREAEGQLLRYFEEACKKIGARAEKKYAFSSSFAKLVTDFIREKDAECAHVLGLRFAYGFGVRKNAERAAYWFGKAAEGGCSDAKYRLGEFYIRTDRRDEGRKLLKEAADAEHVDAQLLLAEIEHDASWLRRAKKNGSRKAANLLKKRGNAC